jgi:hypothetical protein
MVLFTPGGRFVSAVLLEVAALLLALLLALLFSVGLFGPTPEIVLFTPGGRFEDELLPVVFAVLLLLLLALAFVFMVGLLGPTPSMVLFTPGGSLSGAVLLDGVWAMARLVLSAPSSSVAPMATFENFLVIFVLLLGCID